MAPQAKRADSEKSQIRRMETENLETDRKKAKHGTGKGIIKTGISERNNKNFERRSRETGRINIGKIKHWGIGKGKEKSEKQSRGY